MSVLPAVLDFTEYSVLQAVNLERIGQSAPTASWHSVLFQGLSLALVQMDELCVRVRGLDKRHWLWLAIDPVSKTLPALHLSARKPDDAYMLVHDLKERLAEKCVPTFTSDGLRSYFYALTAHFGHWHTAAGALASRGDAAVWPTRQTP